MERSTLTRILRGRRTRRTTTLLLAAAFLLIGAADLFGSHGCPHHSSIAATDSATPGQHAPDAAAPHAHHAPTNVDADAEPSHGAHDAPCTCIGACHGAAATPVPVAALRLATDTAPCTVAANLRATHSRALRLAPFVLPFANGPPALS